MWANIFVDTMGGKPHYRERNRERSITIGKRNTQKVVKESGCKHWMTGHKEGSENMKFKSLCKCQTTLKTRVGANIG
ncbi:MAG: hypothetical protein COA94_03555 [Rickettsiales bacterium]|nr:MAG: hypothetical protein COA94_03555 [Rickettsiales bacterium]